MIVCLLFAMTDWQGTDRMRGLHSTMWRVMRVVIGLLLAGTAAVYPAERRVALVIGNSAYRSVPALVNPANDARLMAETLTALGFTLVEGQAHLDLEKTAFDRTVQAFSTAIPGADVALFYYAGHGIQVRGTNYLVPISANPTREADIDFQMLTVDLVLRQMELARTRLNVVLLDACRNNPFAGRGLRTAGGGLAQMQAPEGTLISYATQPGNVALDGTDGHSPYTRALARALRTPGLDVFGVFNETGLAVKQHTGGAQQPWVSSSPIAGPFFFTAARDQQSASGRDDAVEIAFWTSVQDDKTPEAFQTYLESYPQGKFAALARLKLIQLSEPSSRAPASASSAPPPAPTASAPPPTPRSREAGAQLYHIRCAPCHGPDGKAATPTARALMPTPHDHTDRAYMSHLSNEYLAKIIKHGGAAVGKSPFMPDHMDLNEQQLQDLITFVRALAGSS
jgi:mono/diheme cytochrome c family protein